MGGLRKHLPVTYRTFVIGTLAIAGIPPLAGFFSKDEILAGVFGAHRFGQGALVLLVAGLFTAGLTACYMFRLVYLTFHGEFRGTEEQRHHLHESPPVMTVPLVVLAVGAVASGWVGISPTLTLHRVDLNWLHHFLEPVIARAAGRAPSTGICELALEWGLILASVAVAVLGIWLARRWWGGAAGWRRTRPSRAASRPSTARSRTSTGSTSSTTASWCARSPPCARFCWKVVDVLLIDGSIHVGAFVDRDHRRPRAASPPPATCATTRSTSSPA